MITRLRLGHSMTKAASHKIGVRDNADCAVGRTPDTTEHFLLTCAVEKQLQDNPRRECIQIKNLTTSRPSSQQLPAHASSTTGSCHLSVICKQPLFQPRGLCDFNLHRKEEVVKHRLRRRCLKPTVTELVVFEDVARSTAMVHPELRRQSVEIVEVRIIGSIPFEIGGNFLNLYLFWVSPLSLLFIIVYLSMHETSELWV